jgi:hypothetical protein
VRTWRAPNGTALALDRLHADSPVLASAALLPLMTTQWCLLLGLLRLRPLPRLSRALHTGAKVLDLGCVPGAWLQVACQQLGPNERGGLVLGIDIQEVCACVALGVFLAFLGVCACVCVCVCVGGGGLAHRRWNLGADAGAVGRILNGAAACCCCCLRCVPWRPPAVGAAAILRQQGAGAAGRRAAAHARRAAALHQQREQPLRLRSTRMAC